MLLLSNGRVPEHGFLRGVRGRPDLFGPTAFSPAWEDRSTFLLALILLLVLVLTSVWWRRPLQKPLQVWMLSGSDLHAEGAFPLNLF